MSDKKLEVIPKPDPKVGVMSLFPPDSIIKGDGDVNLLCGNCEAVLVRGAGNSVRNMVLQCGACGSFNGVR